MKNSRERIDLVPALAQGRHVHVDDLQAVIQVLPEIALEHHGLEIAVVAATTRTSTVTRLLLPSFVNSASWRTRSSFACSAGVDLGDFVQEERPAVGLFELPMRVVAAPETRHAYGRTAPTRADPQATPRSSPRRTRR